MLVGVRKVKLVGNGTSVVFEYRLDPKTGKVSKMLGGQPGDEVTLSPFDNVLGPGVAKEHGLEFKPVPKGGRKVTPMDGVDFLVALLVKYGKTTGYSWVEPIENRWGE